MVYRICYLDVYYWKATTPGNARFNLAGMIPLAVTTTILSIPVESMGLLEFFGMMSIGITAGSLGII